MLRPSYSELMEVLNKQEDIDIKVNSRYTIVIAAAKRARQLIDGDEPLSDTESGKAVSIAINEMYEGKLAISLSKEMQGNEFSQFQKGYNGDSHMEFVGDAE